MIFDQLCGIAERQFAPLMRVLREARLVHFTTHRVYPARFDVLTDAKVRELWQEFCLPYSCVAIETPRNLVIVWEEGPLAAGMEAQRSVIVVTPMSAARAGRLVSAEPGARKLHEAAARIHQEHGDFLLVVMGKAGAVLARPFAFVGEVGVAFTAKKEEVIQGNDRLLHGTGRRVMTESFLNDAGEAYARIAWFAVPEFRWLLAPTSRRPVPKGKLARSDQREVWKAL